jgi:hypothetical protein
MLCNFTSSCQPQVRWLGQCVAALCHVDDPIWVCSGVLAVDASSLDCYHDMHMMTCSCNMLHHNSEYCVPCSMFVQEIYLGDGGAPT